MSALEDSGDWRGGEWCGGEWRGGERQGAEQGAQAGMDAVARAELRRARQAVFGQGQTRDMAAFAGRVAQAVGNREPFVPAPNSPAQLSAPHEMVGSRRDVAGGPILGPESVPLPDAPALICDAADRIVRVNPALLRLAGQAREGGADLFGMRLPQLLHGPDADARLIRRDGARVRVRVLRWDVPGHELRAVVLVELGAPVTDDGNGHAHVAELERMANAGTWTFELATSRLRRSAALEQLYQALGWVPGADRAGPESEQVARLCAALRSGDVRPDHQHVELELPGGRILDCRARVEHAADGTPVRLVGIVRDVTPIREAHARVARAGQRFADLLAVLPDGVAAVDPGGRILEVNAALRAMLGFEGAELRGRPLSAITVDQSGERPTGAFPEWLRLIRPGARHGYAVESVPLRRADGSQAWCDLRISVGMADDGGWFWMLVCKDLAERRRATEELRRAALADPVTGLPTWPAVAEELEGLLVGPNRGVVAVATVAVSELDRVRTVLGHAAADQILAELAERLRSELPDGCAVARLSGDGFVVVCPDHREIGLPVDVGRLAAGIVVGGVIVAGRPVRITASAGVAGGVVGRITGADLLRHAELARQEAQRSGAVVVAATDELVGAAATAVALEADLRATLAADGLTVHFQPVVAPDGVVRSAEALVRWEHPERGMIPPAEFLPIARRCGLLRELDLQVLRAATHEAARWPAHDGQVASVAVNLAGLLPADPGFVAAITDAVTTSGLAWDRLVLELVESSLVELPPHARAAMDELAERGVRFALDDFGTGWSGLARLRDVPAQVLKLDRAFVTGVAADPLDRAVARTVLDLADAVGCGVVAEGVETPEQYHALRELGVELVQGWLFARPMPAADMRALLVGDRLPIPA